MSKKDQAWEAIFEALNLEELISENGFATVTAEQIKYITKNNDVGQQEPRLITKFDTREQRPTILRHNNCTILAISNGSYSLFQGDGYHNAEAIPNTEIFTSEHVSSLETLPSVCTSESQVIDTAVASGLLQEFLGEETLSLTIRGRLRSGRFDFKFDDHDVKVDGVQIEVDAGYEGERIYLIEGKMGSRDNFITRQLFYPYRMWDARPGVNKEIIPVFITYSDQTFDIYQYAFNDSNQYNSLELVKSGSYVLANALTGHISAALSRFDSREFLSTVPPQPQESAAPFPQADDLRKVIDTIFAVAVGFDNKLEISEYYDFNERQSDYYGNAARYLGFLELDHGRFILTEEGEEYVKLPKNERTLMMVRTMMRSPTLNTLFKNTVKSGSIPDAESIAITILLNRPELNDTTAKRRAHTMERWLGWLLSKTA